MEELIKRVQEQLDNNWAVDKKDIQRLVNSYMMDTDFINNIPKKAKIQLLGSEEKICNIKEIRFEREELYSITIRYPLGNEHYDFLTYYFDGRKIGTEKDIEVQEVFKELIY